MGIIESSWPWGKILKTQRTETILFPKPARGSAWEDGGKRKIQCLTLNERCLDSESVQHGRAGESTFRKEETVRKAYTILSVGVVALALMAIPLPARATGTLFIGTDTEEFNGASASYLFKATVNGPNLVSEISVPLNFPLNGLGDGPGFLYSGDPNTNTLRTIDYNGNLLTSTTAGFPNTCCNEEMQFFGGNLYHVHWSDNIQQIDPTTGAVLATFAQSDVVGMAQVGSQLWITHWSTQQVGTWDPGTNIFTPIFSTPQLAGALAFDPSSNILWVGQLGGMVIPYDLAGNQLGVGFNALSPLAGLGLNLDTVDGMTFQGESSQPVPEPSTLFLFGSALVGMSGIAWRRNRKG